MKKTLAMILALVMLLALSVPCFAEEKEGPLIGMLALLNINEEDVNEGFSYKAVFYDSLEPMLLALESGKIDEVILPECVVDYIIKTNDKFAVKDGDPLYDCRFAMGTLSDNKEVYELLNSAIETMKENGTLEKLQKEYVDDLVESGAEPKAAEFSVFPDAETITVAVTGDLPPVDYVAADGTPAGFNVALLAEIAKLANVNIKLVQVNSASRLLALTSGTVDAVFCFREYVSDIEELKPATSDDIPDAVSITTEYYTSPNCRMILK